MKKLLFLFSLSFVLSCASENGTVQYTLNGSYAKLLTVGDYLYAINETEITTLDISIPKNPIEIDKQDVGFDIENIYHSNGVLFIGSKTALHIFEIAGNGKPTRKSETNYFAGEDITACDPVITKDNYAYITLSSYSFNTNRGCTRTVVLNELRIYNIEDIDAPFLVSKTRLQEPKGLAIDGNYLFVCEAKNGMKVLDINNPNEPIVIATVTGFESYDIIVKNGIAMIVCPTEIRQYDYTDINNISFLSSIKL